MKKEYSTINTLLQKIGLKAVEVKLEQMKLDDGQTVIEADAFEAGNPVMIVTEDDQRIALPVGEYGLEDGRMLIVSEEGVIGEIKEMAAEEAAPVEEQPVAQAEAPTATPIAKKVVEAVTKESYFSKEEVEAKIAEAIENFKTELSKVEEEAEVVEMAKAITHNPEPKANRINLGSKVSITEFLNNKLK